MTGSPPPAPDTRRSPRSGPRDERETDPDQGPVSRLGRKGSEPPPAELRGEEEPGTRGARDEESTPSPPPRPLPDLSLLVALLEAVRAVVPRELEQQLTTLLRELLLALRALIDRYLERLDGGRREAHIEDIPID